MDNQPTPSQDADIRKTLGRYFDGLYHADPSILGPTFHPDASYVCATDSNLVQLTITDYLTIVDGRRSPASQSQQRRDEIVRIEMAGPNAAAARVHCAIGERYFTDLLTLIKVDGAWQIISKIFHYEPNEGEQ